MGLNRIDLLIIAAYLAGITLFGLRFRKRQRTMRDYFLADRDIPWWAISLSIVAAETSTLTIISIPGLAYSSNLTFLQWVMGYVIGRVIISFVLLPQYFRGELYTAYQLIERRFGPESVSYTHLDVYKRQLDEEIADLPKRPINDEEIKRAKDSILNSFVFRFDSPEKVLQEKMAYEFYGYPLDFLENFQKGIEAVTKEDVARVAAKYLHREQMAVLVVGNVGEFDKPLSSLGTVNKLDVTIPPPPPGLVPQQSDHP